MPVAGRMQHEQLRSKANFGHSLVRKKQDQCWCWQTGWICKHFMWSAQLSWKIDCCCGFAPHQQRECWSCRCQSSIFVTHQKVELEEVTVSAFFRWLWCTVDISIKSKWVWLQHSSSVSVSQSESGKLHLKRWAQVEEAYPHCSLKWAVFLQLSVSWQQQLLLVVNALCFMCFVMPVSLQSCLLCKLCRANLSATEHQWQLQVQSSKLCGKAVWDLFLETKQWSCVRFWLTMLKSAAALCGLPRSAERTKDSTKDSEGVLSLRQII
jgi:hypothetical protein